MGVLTVCSDTPAGSANMVCARRSATARWFILSTNAATEPASHRARVSAMLLPDGMSNASSTSYSVSCSPAVTGTTDCPSAASAL